jgi:hypothetical protein
MSETPRTDAVWRNKSFGFYEMRDIANTLERELAAMTAEIQKDRTQAKAWLAVFACCLELGHNASRAGETGVMGVCRFIRESVEQLAAMTAERDALVQTSGTPCPWCGWRGLRGDAGECAFCQNAQLSADVSNLRKAKEIAERQVAVLASYISETGQCPGDSTCCCSGVKCSDCWAAWSREQAVKEGGKG